jgi:uncharacterized protein YdeI (YjbR/CyaY-like superfamily)
MTFEVAPDGLPVIPFGTMSAWREWLEENHESAEGLWLKIAKRSSGIVSVTFGEALDVALCFGWIDNRKMGFDRDWYLLRFTPRRESGTWSEANRKRVERLADQGLMHPAGLTQVERAREDGRWPAV